MKLKPFQETRIAELKDKFLTLWQMGDRELNLTFKSPTGSGKTIMLAQFLRDLAADPRFSGADVGFLWITKGGGLAEQSRKKLAAYYGGAGEITLVGIDDLREGKLSKNSVFFVNWEKLVSRARENRILRAEGEANTTFDEYLTNTRGAGREIVLIIDEEHIASATMLGKDLVRTVIQPRIVLGVSATPQTAGSVKVEVSLAEVRDAGLIREIYFQTEEELRAVAAKTSNQDLDRTLLELAFAKREALTAAYQEIGAAINPLCLIQLPNDDQALRDTGTATKQEIAWAFLREKGVDENDIGIWLADEKKNLDGIEENDSPVKFLLFKQAAATGWDCPRAGVLAMFREIKNPTFAVQTVGRILRMPGGERLSKAELNCGFVYTNYQRNEVLSGYAGAETGNRAKVFVSKRKEKITPLDFESCFISRADYNDLGDSFSKTFAEVADRFFGLTIEDKFISDAAAKKMQAKGLNLRPQLTQRLIVDAKIDDYDNLAALVRGNLWSGADLDRELSPNDIQRWFNRLCFEQLSRQTDALKKFAPERSWGKVKTALRLWFNGANVCNNYAEIYRVVVFDLTRSDSVLAPVIDEALAVYRPIRDGEVGKRAENQKQIITVKMPPDELRFTNLYEEEAVNTAAMVPFYFEKNYPGRDNEKKFIDYLECQPSVEWWYKNGDYGGEHLALVYQDAANHRERLFYPDWLFKTAEAVWLVDTKGGWTAEENETRDKARALSEWLKNKPGFRGGIAVQEGSGWKINSAENYTSPYAGETTSGAGELIAESAGEYSRKISDWKRLDLR